MQKDKHRDVARGVLPSTARKGARDNKRNFHAKNRHAQRQATHAIERHLATVSDHGTVVHDPDLYDDFEDKDIIDGYHASTKPDGCSYDHDIGYIVRRRQDADNLGPLYAWAEGVERKKMVGWSNDDKYQYFKAVLPDTLQGRHALGHVEDHLDLSNDEFSRFWRYYNTSSPHNLEAFRAALAKHLSSPKRRLALREFLRETIPVAAHRSPTNNKVKTSEPAVDENGKPRYGTRPFAAGGVAQAASVYPLTVDVYVPQMVSVTCDDCSFLRNDPLATTEAVNRFVTIVWNGRPAAPTTWWERQETFKNHRYDHYQFLREIREHILSTA